MARIYARDAAVSKRFMERRERRQRDMEVNQIVALSKLQRRARVSLPYVAFLDPKNFHEWEKRP